MFVFQSYYLFGQVDFGICNTLATSIFSPARATDRCIFAATFSYTPGIG
jgi:hypothetical protein